jgi:hypothetical protein
VRYSGRIGIERDFSGIELRIRVRNWRIDVRYARSMEEGVYVPIEIGGFGVVLSLHTSVNPSAESWLAFLDILRAVLKEHRGNVDELRGIVISDGGAPSATQRKQVMDVVHGKANKIGVITNSLDNPLKRGVATAITWLNPAFRAAPPARWSEIFAHLDLQAHVDEVLLEFDTMQAKLPKVTTLAEVRRLVRLA